MTTQNLSVTISVAFRDEWQIITREKNMQDNQEKNVTEEVSTANQNEQSGTPAPNESEKRGGAGAFFARIYNTLKNIVPGLLLCAVLAVPA